MPLSIGKVQVRPGSQHTSQGQSGNLVQMQPLFPQGLAGDRSSKHLPGEPVQPILTLRVSFPPSLEQELVLTLSRL